MTAPLELRDVLLSRGSFRLDVPALSAEPGTIIGLVGRNGAGKTTLLQVAAGLLAVRQGTVRTFGVDPVADPVAARLKTCLMSDDMPVFAMKMGDHLRAVSRFYPTWDAALVGRLLTHFELKPGKRTTELSKGEATTFRLVLSLAFRPKLALLDEPATGLDVPSRRKLLRELLEIVTDSERTVVISSHDVADIERIADRIVVMDEGRIVADGTPHEVVGEARTLEELLAGGVA